MFIGNFNMSKFDEDERPSRSNNNSRNNNTPSRLGGLKFKSLTGFKGTPFGGKKDQTRKDRVSNENANPKQTVIDQAVIDDFVEAYIKNKADIEVCQDLLKSQFVEVASILTNYYNNDYKNIVESMNNVIKLMTTKTFVLNLLGVVKKKDDLFLNWNEDRVPIAEAISLALETSHSKMIDETKSMYIEIISEHIYDFEIKEISKKFKLTEDAAIDLVIGVPRFGRTMTDSQISHSYDNYLNMLINHGGCAIDYLNAEHQKELFYYLFIDENRVAVKAASYCLASPLLQFENEADEALYEEYLKMLYEVINEHDLEDIRVMLRHMVKTRAKIVEEKRDDAIVFDTEKAIEYDNIRKALVDYIEHSNAAKKFLDSNWTDLMSDK